MNNRDKIDVMVAEIMTYMENEFNIPIFEKDSLSFMQSNETNYKLMTLYKMISNLRKL